MLTKCRHVIFTNFLRWNIESYLLRALWLSEAGHDEILHKGFTATMRGKNSMLKSKGKFAGGEFRNPNLEMLRLQYETSDVIQTVMRTNLRDDPKAAVHVWLPGSNVRKIGMLLDYFVGAKVVIEHTTK